MSDIRQDGEDTYGMSHEWKIDITDVFGGTMGTRYFCRDCGECFVHLYHIYPNINSAMRFEEIRDVCTKVKV